MIHWRKILLCTDEYRKQAFPWVDFLLNCWRKKKKNQVNFCFHQEPACSVKCAITTFLWQKRKITIPERQFSEDSPSLV